MQKFIKLKKYIFRISEIQCVYHLLNFEGEYCVYVRMKDSSLYEIIKTPHEGDAIVEYLQIEKVLI